MLSVNSKFHGYLYNDCFIIPLVIGFIVFIHKFFHTPI